jgi:hypothetical protein
MKWAIKILVLPLFPIVVFLDCVVWNATHGMGRKTNPRSSAGEIWRAWKKW